jgi:replicative DNA helicase
METLNRSNVAPLKRFDQEPPALRAPPLNVEAETNLLGALLANNRSFDRVSEFLEARHFADARHGRIFAACATLIQRGMVANPITLKNYFEQDNQLAEIGGPDYLARLAGSVVSVVNAVDYAKLIHDLYLRRQLISLGEDVVNRAYAHDLEQTAQQQIEIAEQGLFELATSGRYDGGFASLDKALADAIDLAEAAYKRDSHVTGVTTGLRDLDKKLGGLHPSDLVILAGRPSMGKSALATKIAFAAAAAYREKIDEDGQRQVQEGAKVAFFSLEMSTAQLATRMLAEQTEIPSDRIRRGEVRKEDFPRFVEVSSQLSRLPLYLDDTASLSVSQLRARSRRLKRQEGLGLIVIDYLQLLTPPPSVRSENRVQEISAITRALKALAKELNVPVLALSQLSRAVENREDKRPQLADLRESGTIEQDADVVMFVFREEYYHTRAEPVQRQEEGDERFHERYIKWQQRGEKIHNKAEVVIGKQRHGPIGIVPLFFDSNFTKFDDLAFPDQLPEDGD